MKSPPAVGINPQRGGSIVGETQAGPRRQVVAPKPRPNPAGAVAPQRANERSATERTFRGLPEGGPGGRSNELAEFLDLLENHPGEEELVDPVTRRAYDVPFQEMERRARDAQDAMAWKQAHFFSLLDRIDAYDEQAKAHFLGGAAEVKLPLGQRVPCTTSGGGILLPMRPPAPFSAPPRPHFGDPSPPPPFLLPLFPCCPMDALIGARGPTLGGVG